MEQLWYPAASVELGVSAGASTGGNPKIVLHTTEGHRYADALAVYRQHGYWPTGTLTYENGRPEAHQHLPYGAAAAALEHRRGTGETNRDNVVAQLEIVGTSVAGGPGLYVEDFPDDYLAAIGAWLAHIAANTPAPLVAPYPFGPEARRLAWPEWHAAAGILGHAHVPSNNHSDPGALNVARILTLTGGPPMAELATYVRHYHRRAGGIWKLGSDGGIFADGGAPFYGSLGGMTLNAPAVALVPTPSEAGYWIVTADGGIFASNTAGQMFGDARPILPYLPLVTEYRLGARRIVDAALCPIDGASLDLLSNLGEEYHLA